MGRIKTQLIKRTARKLFNKYRGEAKPTFEENKSMVARLLENPNKKMRNIVAGYLARLVKQEQESSKPKPRPRMMERAERSRNYTSRQR